MTDREDIANRIYAIIKVVQDRGHQDPESRILNEIFWDYLNEFGPERDGPGRKPRKLLEYVALLVCASAVTALKKEGGVDRAIREVAKAAGFSRKDVKNFRDSLHRGTAHPQCMGGYKKVVADCESMSKEEILVEVEVIGDICRKRRLLST
jgi:hypothetical protein